MMRSASIFLLSLVINFVIFATVINVTASHDKRAKNIPVPIRFIKIEREPLPVKALLEAPASKPKPLQKSTPIKKEIRIKKPLEAPPVAEEVVDVAKNVVHELESVKAPIEAPERIKEVVEHKEVVKPEKANPTEPEPVKEESVAKISPQVEDVSQIVPQKPYEVDESNAKSTKKSSAVEGSVVVARRETVKEANVITPLDEVTKYPRVAEPIRPIYPERARRKGEEGTVELELLIDSGGEIIETKVVKSAGDAFDSAAIDAIKRAEFLPAMIGKRAVTVRVTIPIKFELK